MDEEKEEWIERANEVYDRMDGAREKCGQERSLTCKSHCTFTLSQRDTAKTVRVPCSILLRLFVQLFATSSTVMKNYFFKQNVSDERV